ncbi:uncharacterized protein LOC111828559 [Capsella rubella]|uniref:uncharacterized protein LOC111828559 n=1 Tax=Capsella rubella TaxID=81985 RepID=UPI000CD59208|nr:uncharacterized protein LOC111828559 [Capsella rubella]
MADPRSEQALNLQIHLTAITNPYEAIEEDSYAWVIEGKSCEGYSSSKTWSVLRPRAEEVSWHRSVWFKGAIPRNAFNMWIANLDRLPTKTRLANWGVNINPICDLCNTNQESRDHLFLTCDYALYIWNAVSRRLSLPGLRFQNWMELIAWTKTKNIRSPTTLRKLVAEAVIYALWKQRNNVVHNQVHIPPSVLFKDIDRELKNSITARSIKKSFKSLMARWLRRNCFFCDPS